ncbi:MAG: glycosyltransferase family 2 protein, partial [Saprospiraceae bacterium]|nr:glycosyltransferase family 2 protein [Saprospiraceae bacterium]
MNPILENIIPEYLQYWYYGGPDKFCRIFWHFLIFEFTRYIIIDFVVLFWFWANKKNRQGKWEEARQQFLNEQPFVSVIVPGKNEGQHLYKLVKSLNEQTFQNFELIIVDDGSNDRTPLIGKSLLKNGMLTQFLRNDVRGGKASAANLALRFSKGKYVVHLDADCSFDRDAIENILIPFYFDPKIGAVGGNVKVRDFESSIAARLQAIEYLKTIAMGRTVTSELGIYKIISGAFGAFNMEATRAIGGWDIGPGLDGDITVKLRKSGYKIHFEPSAICLTSVPANFKILKKQRLRWDKSIIRFRVRKHNDVFTPHAEFRWSTFFALFENIFYNVVLNIAWWLYFIDILVNFTGALLYIVPMNITLYVVAGYLQMISLYFLSERKEEEFKLWGYVPLM